MTSSGSTFSRLFRGNRELTWLGPRSSSSQRPRAKLGAGTGAPTGSTRRSRRCRRSGWTLTAAGTFTFEVSSHDFDATVPPGTTQDVVCAPGDWRELTDDLVDPPQRMVTNASTDNGAFIATFRYLETPYVATFTCRPDGESLTIDVRYNVSFGPTEFTLHSL